MYRQFFSNLDSAALPLFAMALFLTLFVAVLVRTFVLRTKADYQPLAALPLEDDAVKETSP